MRLVYFLTILLCTSDVSGYGVLRLSDCIFAGYKCVSPASTPIECLQGEFSPEGTTICVVCSDGYYTASIGSAICTPCPAGKYCAAKNSGPTDCGPGEYRYVSCNRIDVGCFPDPTIKTGFLKTHHVLQATKKLICQLGKKRHISTKLLLFFLLLLQK